MAIAGTHRRTTRHANLASLVVWPPWAVVRVEPVGLVAVGMAVGLVAVELVAVELLAVEPLEVGLVAAEPLEVALLAVGPLTSKTHIKRTT